MDVHTKISHISQTVRLEFNMKKEVAHEINTLMLDYFAKLNASVKLVQQQCNEEEFQRYRKVIGKIMGEMSVEIMMPLYTEYPDLEPEEFKK